MRYSNNTILPNNFLAEQAILHILLTNPSLISETLDDLTAETFYFPPHRLIYESLLELTKKNQILNITEVITHLQDTNKLKQCGGIERIKIILNEFANFLELNRYLKLVNEKYVRRKIIETGKQIIVLGYTTSDSLDVIFNKMEYSFFLLNQKNESQNIYSSAEIVEDVFAEITSKVKKTTLAGFESCFKDLDALLQGIQKSDLIVVAGRPSMGKTAFALNLGVNVVKKHQVPLIIFTLEMSRQQIVYRFLSSLSSINANRLKSARMNANEWKSLQNSMKEFSQLPIYIDDNPNITLNDIRGTIQKIFGKSDNKGIVLIDYLQLMKGNFKLDNRVQEISYITRNLKILAKEFEIPIILLSQLSRSVESRINKRPMLSDLRESGCVTTPSNFGNNTLTKSPSFSTFSRKGKHIVNETYLEFEFKGVKPTFLITFDNDVKIYLTSNHRVFSHNGWVRVSELKKESKIYSLIKKENKKTAIQYKYNEIKSIQYLGIHAVYDKTIANFHNYFLEDILLHNSIEQDADVVIMLYRDGYYNKEAAELGVTELIVAKHRNGPIGTARLLFKPSTTTFENLV